MVYFDDNSRSLILTSKESPDGFFFGGKDDHFWEVIRAAANRYNNGTVPDTIEKKKDFCEKYHLALATINDCKEVIANLKKTHENPATPVKVFCTDEAALNQYNKQYKKILGLEAKSLPVIPKKFKDLAGANKERKALINVYEDCLLQHIERNFDPIVNSDSRILILGTMPSEVSQENEFYYGNPGNRFWEALARAFGEKVELLTKKKNKKYNSADKSALNEARTKFCKEHQIALWDVVNACTMVAGADKSIKSDQPDFKCNDIKKILKKAKIEKIFCTGATSFELYNSFCEKETNMPATRLHSPSGSAKNEDKGGLSDDHLYAEYKKELRKILK